MQLKSQIKTVIEVDYSDLDAFIEHHLGHDYSTPAAMESGNDTTISVNVTGTHYDLDAKGHVPGMSDYERKEVEEFIATGDYGSYSPSVSAILEYLCCEGLVPAGDWSIRVSW